MLTGKEKGMIKIYNRYLKSGIEPSNRLRKTVARIQARHAFDIAPTKGKIKKQSKFHKFPHAPRGTDKNRFGGDEKRVRWYRKGESIDWESPFLYKVCRTPLEDWTKQTTWAMHGPVKYND